MVIDMENQGLHYGSIVDPSLLMKSRFQRIEVVDRQLAIEFGPGDYGFMGGRWWVDINGDNIQDEGYAFIS